MVQKGIVQPNHIPVNNFELIVVGLPPILFTTVSGFDEETQSVEMPDRTMVTGGNSTAVEFEGTTFEHHSNELPFLELWRTEGVDPVSPTYKKVGTLIKRKIDGTVGTTRTLFGLWVKNRSNPDLDLANEGEPAMITWTFSADKVESI